MCWDIGYMYFFGFRVDFLSGSIGSRLNVRKAILKGLGQLRSFDCKMLVVG